MNNEIILSVKNLHKYFQSGVTTLKVLTGIDLTVKKGEIVVITGESGAGKTTLLSLIGGIDSPTSGSIKIKNIEITNLNEEELNKFRAKYLGFMFQYHYLLPEFTALENVYIPLLITEKRFKKDFYNKAKKFLKEVGLETRINHKPSALSGGECQRVALSRALVKNPEIVIMDEPTGNLDEKNSALVIDLIKKLNKKYENTFIIATHNLEFLKIADTAYLLKSGVLHKR